MEQKLDCIIVGGGLAGLVCARRLAAAGKSFQLLEASDEVGGRVRTDVVDGFRLDRGFQVFLTAYPEAKKILDYDKLQLRSFEPGALVRHCGKFHRLSDPLRRPQHALSTVLSPAATLADKLKILSFRSHTNAGDLDSLYRRAEHSTLDLLRDRGFSEVIRERFFRPFLGGVFLDHKLETSSRLCEFVFRMFSTGQAALPAEGMQAIPRQLADGLPESSVRTNCPVKSVDDGSVTLASGETVDAKTIVIATDAPTSRMLLGDTFPADGRSVRCFYFAADKAPLAEPILVLNGDGEGPINNLCVPSQVSAAYAPSGKSLVSVTSLDCDTAEDELRSSVEKQLVEWYGNAASHWAHLKSYTINYALPVQSPPGLEPVEKPAEVRPGLYICGDHCDTASINGAMASGRRAAESVIATVV
jgi:phytoene dehydrogenase-like protein